AFQLKRCPDLIQILWLFLPQKTQNAALQSFVIAPPLGAHLCTGAEDLIYRDAEPLNDGSTEEAKGERGQQGRRNQSKRDKRYQDSRLEFRTGLLLLAFRPRLYQCAEQDESENQKNQEYQR